jgi:hypothetical protein
LRYFAFLPGIDKRAYFPMVLSMAAFKWNCRRTLPASMCDESRMWIEERRLPGWSRQDTADLAAIDFRENQVAME